MKICEIHSKKGMQHSQILNGLLQHSLLEKVMLATPQELSGVKNVEADLRLTAWNLTQWSL